MTLINMTNYATGHKAEEYAAKYLQKQGYKIVALNWKTKYCEIDLVAKKDNVIYLVEVKYRQNDRQGRGLDYITPKKLKQMKFSAEMWVENNNWSGDYCLAALEIDSGGGTNFIEIDS